MWQVSLSDLDLQWQYPALGTVSALTTVAAWGALVLFLDVATDRERSTFMIFTFTHIYHIATIVLIDLWEWLLVGVVIKHERTIQVMGLSAVLSCRVKLVAFPLVATHAVNESVKRHIVIITFVITGEGIRASH